MLTTLWQILASSFGGSVVTSIIKKFTGVQNGNAQLLTGIINFLGPLGWLLFQHTNMLNALAQAVVTYLAAHGVYATVGKATKTVAGQLPATK